MAAVGFYGSKGPFFAMPPMFLSGTALAGLQHPLGDIGAFIARLLWSRHTQSEDRGNSRRRAEERSIPNHQAVKGPSSAVSLIVSIDTDFGPYP